MGLGAGCAALTMMGNDGRCVRDGHMLFRILLVILVVSGCFQSNSDGGIVLGRRRENRSYPFDSCFRRRISLSQCLFGNIPRRKARCRRNLPFEEVAKKAGLAEVWMCKAAIDVRIQEERS